VSELVFDWQDDSGPHEARVTSDAPAILGRAGDSTVHLDSLHVSRHHAQVRRRAAGFAIADLTSGRNPVFVNREAITSEMTLAEGDQVTLGNVTLRVARIAGAVAEPGGPMLQLRWSLNGEAHSESVAGGDPVTIGRSETCTIVLPSLSVSRTHAQIREASGRFAVSDLTQGRNRVTVNERPLTGERFLNAGDTIRLGQISLLVVAATGTTRGTTPANARLVTCSHCHREVDGRLLDCPWCGTALVNADTVLPRF
jgi:pSer/pThr/pTyr-binding forkhead associated (FHA) protein